MKRRIQPLALLTIATLASLPAFAGDAAELLRHCVPLPDDDLRLACYDAAASKLGIVDDQPVPAAASAEAAAAASGTGAAAVAGTAAESLPAVPDDLGQPPKEGEEGTQADEYQARVIKCEQGSSSNRYFFFFENGQVWKQSNTGRLRLGDCQFDAILTRDLFGYKLRIESENKTVRVSRVK